MAHVQAPSSIVEEQPDPDTQDASVQPKPAPVQPPLKAPEGWLPWGEIERDPKYQRATPAQQRTARERYWEKYLGQHPKIQALPDEEYATKQEQFLAGPPVPKSMGAKIADAAKQELKSFRGHMEALYNFASEAVGGTAAIGAGALGSLSQIVQGELRGRPELIPQTYEAIRDSVRKYAVYEPRTAEGKRSQEALMAAPGYVMEEFERGVSETQDAIYKKLEPALGADQAAKIAISIAQGGIRGTAIMASLGLVGFPKGVRAGKVPDKPTIEEAAPVVEEVPVAVEAQAQLEGPLGGQRLLEDQREPGPSSTIPDEAQFHVIEQPAPFKRAADMEKDELVKMVLTDELTDLPNRRAYNEATKKPIAVLSDIDGLKYFNDNISHGFGDVVLQAKAQASKELGLEIYRTGRTGDEFISQFNTVEEANAALSKLQEKLKGAIIEYTTPDGKVQRFKGITFSYGIGKNLPTADVALNANKAARRAQGLRAQAGERPPGLEELVEQPAEGRQVPSAAAEVALSEAAPSAAPPSAPSARTVLPSSPEPVGGVVLPSEAIGPVLDLRKDRYQLIKEAAERHRAKQRGEPAPKPEPVLRLDLREGPAEQPKEPGQLQRARPEKGLPIVELSAEAFEAEVARSKRTPMTPEERGIAGSINLYSGIPIDQVVALYRWTRGQISPKYRQGKDLTAYQAITARLWPVDKLLEIDPIAHHAAIENTRLRHKVWYGPAYDARVQNLKIVKELSNEERFTVAQMLNTFNNVLEIPLDVLKARRDITEKVLEAFTAARRQFNSHWELYQSGLTEKQRAKAPKYIDHYFTIMRSEKGQLEALMKDNPDAFENVIRNFADKNNFPYEKARRILLGQTPQQGFFGPLTKARHGGPELDAALREWDLLKVMDFYTDGVHRKRYVDQMLKLQEKLVPRIVHSRTRDFVRGYFDQQRGVDTSVSRKIVQENPTLRKALRIEALWQTGTALGVDLPLAIFNMGQVPVNNMSKALWGSISKLEAGPMQDFARASVDVFTKRGRKLIAESRVNYSPGAWEYEKGRRGVEARGERIVEFVTFFQRMGDTWGKSLSYLEGYYRLERLSRGVDPKKIELEVWKELEGYKNAAEKAFFYDKSLQPMVYNNPWLANMGRFKKWTLNTSAYVAGLSVGELVVMAGVLDVLGGPDAIPGMRQLFAALRRNHPDSDAVKVLTTMQNKSVAGAAGVDISKQMTINFAMDPDWWEKATQNFWPTVIGEVSGPTTKKIQNMYYDIQSGYFDKDHPDWKNMGIAVLGHTNSTLRDAARSFKEWEKHYIEYRGGDRGVELSKRDVVLRGFGLTSQQLARRQQEYTKMVQDIHKVNAQREDLLKELRQIQKQADEQGWTPQLLKADDELQDRIDKFGENELVLDLGLDLDGETIKNTILGIDQTPEERVTQSKIQEMLLMDRLAPYRPEPW